MMVYTIEHDSAKRRATAARNDTGLSLKHAKAERIRHRITYHMHPFLSSPRTSTRADATVWSWVGATES